VLVRPKLAAGVFLACSLLLALAAAAPVRADLLVPPGKKVWWGVSDTGDPADFGEFSDDLNKHPAVMQSFRTWDSDFDEVIRRWQIANARPIIHISTEDNNTGAELITPAFRRIYVIVHGGGKRRALNRRLAKAGLPPLTVSLGGLPKAPVAVVWSPLPSGSPTVPHNRPRHFYPGSRWVDWAGTDFYSGYPEWKSLTGLYRKFSGKPFAITEWAVHAGDDPAFVSKLFAWVRSHPRCKMLVYYQDFGATSTYRIQNYASSLSVLRARLHSGRFPAYAPNPPKLPPPPPGGVTPSR
jgi:hypothetical protein